jgi:ATP-binding cassette subfamily B protein
MAVWPLVIIGPSLIVRRVTPATAVRKVDESAVLVRVDEMVAVHRVIRAFGLQRHTAERFERYLGRFARSNERATRLGLLVERSGVVAIYAAQLAAVGVGAWLALQGRISVGALVTFLAAFWNVAWYMMMVGRAASPTLAAARAARSIDRLLDEPVDHDQHRGSVTLGPFSGEIELKNVVFGYDPNQPMLLLFSASIRKGEHVVFVGPSGAGKSTILNLLIGFHRPQAGQILCDGVDLADVDPDVWRSRIGIVLQDTALFDTTIRENIRLGKLEATDEEVVQAAEHASVHDAILALPNGYDTMVGQGGSALSGGQRQRVALARAFIRDPEIIVLDEAFSALDPASEAAILSVLETYGRGRTIISVTHRLAAARNADLIHVVRAGRLHESGSHETLLAKGGLYAELWRKQHGFTLSADGALSEITAERLGSITLFSPLTDSQRRSLAPLFVSEQAAAGTTIIEEGRAGDRFYVLVRGTVSVAKRTPDGSSQEVARLSDGDEFGEIALLDDAPRNATITAVTGCLLLSLERTRFLALLSESPDLRDKVERLARGRRHSDADAPERIAG